MATFTGKFIYLASPYSKYHGGRVEAFKLACKKAGQLMEQGYAVFCPIAHSHSIEENAYKIPKDGDWWLSQDFVVLDHVDELWVYQMPGWQDSYGVNKEVEFASNKGIPIKYIPYDVENGLDV